MQLGGFGLISTMWQRDVASASLFTEPWLTSAHWVAHDSLVCHSVVPSFIYKAALLNIWWFWFVSLELPWHKVIQDEAIDQQLLRILKSFLVGDAQCSPNPTSSCSRDVLWSNCLHFEPSPSHTWSHWVVGPCSQCVIHYQSAFINASDSCRVTFSVSGCWGSKPSISPTLIQFLFFSLLVYKT